MMFCALMLGESKSELALAQITTWTYTMIAGYLRGGGGESWPAAKGLVCTDLGICHREMATQPGSQEPTLRATATAPNPHGPPTVSHPSGKHSLHMRRKVLLQHSLAGFMLSKTLCCKALQGSGGL